MKLAFMLMVLNLSWLAGCARPSTKVTPNPDHPEYAELRIGTDGRTQVLLQTDVWYGIFGPEGFLGSKTFMFNWTTLSGDGPVYSNPKFNVNGPYQHDHRGTITVDRKQGRVVVDLMQVISAPGEPERLELSPVNGTYPIKETNHHEFTTPE